MIAKKQPMVLNGTIQINSTSDIRAFDRREVDVLK